MGSQQVKTNSESAKSRQTKSKHPRIKFWFVIAILITIALAFLLGGDGMWQSFILNREVNRLQTKVDSLKTLNEQIQKRVDGLNSGDLDILEDEARRYNMIKPGEKIFIMKSEEERKEVGK